MELVLIDCRVDGANADVIRAVDFVGSDAYPYWQGATVPQSADVFWKSVDDVRNAVNSVKVRIIRTLATSSSGCAQVLYSTQVSNH